MNFLIAGSYAAGGVVIGGFADDQAGYFIASFFGVVAICLATSRDPGSLLYSHSAMISSVPEPSSLALLGLGGLASVGVARRRRHRADAGRSR